MQPRETRLKALFQKFLRGQCSAEELKELLDHFEKAPEDTPLRELLREQLRRRELPGAAMQQRTQKIVAETDKKVAAIRAQAKPRHTWWYPAAAVLLVLILAGTFYKELFTGLFPAGQLQAVTANGEHKHLTLADGTQVWLNAASTLTYPGKFGKGARKVQLSGEAFFEVEADPRHPFVVELPDSLVVTVLGTSFNAKSYRRESRARVSVRSGKVRVRAGAAARARSLSLRPGEEALWQPGDTLIKKETDLSAIASWRSGRLRFHEDPFSDVVAALERKYDVRIEVRRKDLLEEKTSFSLGNEPLEELLIPLSFSHHFKYHFARDSTLVIQ